MDETELVRQLSGISHALGTIEAKLDALNGLPERVQRLETIYKVITGALVLAFTTVVAIFRR